MHAPAAARTLYHKAARLWQHLVNPEHAQPLHHSHAIVTGSRMNAGMRREVRWAPGLVACALVLAFSAFFPPLTLAADPQAYRVQFVSTGHSALDSTIKATSQLQTLRASAPVNPYGLIARARGDVDRLNTVLESFGYYEGSVKITIEGLTLDAPNLGDTLTALPTGKDAHITIALEPGPLFHVGTIELKDSKGDLPAGSKLDLATGAPAIASVVLAAGSQLQTRLQDEGYAFATVDSPVAYEDPQKRLLNLVFEVQAGRRVDVGEIHFQGLKRTHEPLLRRRLLLHTGEHYNAANVERARKDLLNLGIFSSVSVRLGETADSLGRVPVTFVVRERPRHAVGLTGSYSSDLGASGGLTWSDRNIFGNGEELDLSGTMINLGGTATVGLGYAASAKYILPDLGHRDQSLQFALGAVKQNLQAYDQTAETAGVILSRKVSSVWSASVGVSAETEQIVQGGCIGDFPYSLASPDSCLSSAQLGGSTPPPLVQLGRNYTLVGLPLSVSYDSTNLASPLEDPLHGTRGALTLTPTLSIGRPNATFLVELATIAHYIDFHGLIGTAPGRTVLALRAMAGVAVGASEFSLPPDQRFYAGGSGTVRGYNYQSVGPQFTAPGGNPIGGTSLTDVNVELRQRIATNFGAAVFIDGGGVSESQSLLPVSTGAHCVGPPAPSSPRPAASQSGVFCLGVGTGIRYYTPIGPIRVDFAVPGVRRQDDARFEVYIGLGQAF
jgi:translocation and assembly module TamA